MQLQAVQGDITKFDVDAIVNAANTALRRGSGVCGAIFAAAGDGLEEACAELGRCEAGEAVATSGFNLPAKWIIHTVGPVWKGGMSDEATVLASCYRRTLAAIAHVPLAFEPVKHRAIPVHEHFELFLRFCHMSDQRPTLLSRKPGRRLQHQGGRRVGCVWRQADPRVRVKRGPFTHCRFK
jgi:hypothetical protein